MSDNIELVIFDCDGVVIDSEILSADVLIEMLAGLQINIDRAYVQQHFLGCSFKTVSEKIFASFAVHLPEQFENNYRQALLAQFDTQLQATQGIKTVLPNLAIPCCIATSSSPARTAKALDVVGLARYFAANIFTSEEVKQGKPAPDLFLHTAKKMGVLAQHCLVIEDSDAGVRAAIDAGMQVLHYSGGRHLQSAVNNVHKNHPQVMMLTHWQHFFAAFPLLKKSEEM